MNIIIELTVDDVLESSHTKSLRQLSISDFKVSLDLLEKADVIVFRNPFEENVIIKQRFLDRAPSIIDRRYVDHAHLHPLTPDECFKAPNHE